MTFTFTFAQAIFLVSVLDWTTIAHAQAYADITTLPPAIPTNLSSTTTTTYDTQPNITFWSPRWEKTATSLLEPSRPPKVTTHSGNNKEPEHSIPTPTTATETPEAAPIVVVAHSMTSLMLPTPGSNSPSPPHEDPHRPPDRDPAGHVAAPRPELLSPDMPPAGHYDTRPDIQSPDQDHSSHDTSHSGLQPPTDFPPHDTSYPDLYAPDGNTAAHDASRPNENSSDLDTSHSNSQPPTDYSPVYDPSHPNPDFPETNPASPNMVLSSLENLLATATLTGAGLAAHFTTAVPVISILATATITNPQLAAYLHTAPPYVLGEKTILPGGAAVVVAGTTYSVASSAGDADVVFVNGKPMAETAVPGLKGGDSMAEIIDEMNAEETESAIRGGKSTFSTATSSAGTTASTSTSATPSMHTGGASAGGLKHSGILLCMLLCALACL